VSFRKQTNGVLQILPSNVSRGLTNRDGQGAPSVKR
jgi:hypothetical protein